MTAVIQCAIDCHWDNDESLLLHSSADLYEWKSAAFAWHEPSLYGTMLVITDWNGSPAVRMDPLMALDYFADPCPLEHSEIEWGREAMRLKAAAPLLKEVLAKGWYMPDAAAWTDGAGGWKLQLPEQELGRLKTLEGYEEEEAAHLTGEWLNRAVRYMLQRDPQLREDWEQLQKHYPILLQERPLHDGMDEEDWLVAAGFRKDDCPFRISLQVQEPSAGEDMWRFCAALQDVHAEEKYFLLTFDGQPIGEAPPADWEPFIARVLRKTMAGWTTAVPDLASTDKPGVPRGEADDAFIWDFLTAGCLKLSEAGYSVMLPDWWQEVRKQQPKLRAKIRSSVGTMENRMLSLSNLVDFDWRLAVGDLDLSEEQFRQLFKSSKRLLQFQGQWIQLDPSYWERLRKSIQRYRKKGLTLREVLEIHLAGSHSPEAVEADAATDLPPIDIEVMPDEYLTDVLAKLQSASSMPYIDPPQALNAQMRHYQQIGASWMVFLSELGLGGILADDMGLGKTLQWIAYLLHLQQHRSLDAPALLVCPTSVLGNWQKELNRFAPSLRFYVHHGANRLKEERFRESIQGVDLVLTTYPLIHPDEETLASIEWGAVCLDEAQNIKNANAKQTIAIRKLNTARRIALTGTPIENRLTELWSIMEFVNPSYLGPLSKFKRIYVNPIERTGDPQRIGQIQKLVQPFLLRRMKKDPAIQLDLPDKNEMKVFVPLTAEQGAAYEQTVRELMEKIDHVPIMERRALIFTAMTRLKQICDHPGLVYRGRSDRVRPESSHKCIRLLEMIGEVKQAGDKCLVFTQFVQMGTYLQEFLQGMYGEPVDFLHGSVPVKKRNEMIDRFQDPAGRMDVMILSLKAGGTGLNLTAANHVFHFDRWWNPAVENQATDRAFRIGQTKDVQVHKFIALGTMEERIDEMIERKLDLSEQVMGGGEQWISEMSTGELRNIFALRREWIEA